MSEKKLKVLSGRLCYGHLGGTLGERLLQRLIELEWLTPEADKTTVFQITDKGKIELEKLGVDIYSRR
jgi:predicted transcriptional regulator